MALGEVVAGLDAALRLLGQARRHLAAGLDRLTEAAELLTATLRGSEQPEREQVRARLGAAQAELQQQYAQLVIAETAIKKVRRTCATPVDPPPAAAAPPASTRSVPPGVVNRHGDRYPAAAAGLAEALPPRVVSRRGERTVGIPRSNGQLGAPVRSGHDARLDPAIRARLGELGLAPEFLRFHVEIKVAATMIATGRQEVELAINNVPCGIEVQKYWNDVCDKVLARFLPEGFTLTVYGTTRDNQPWRKTYTGRRST